MLNYIAVFLIGVAVGIYLKDLCVRKTQGRGYVIKHSAGRQFIDKEI